MPISGTYTTFIDQGSINGTFYIEMALSHSLDYVSHRSCITCASLGLGCCSRCQPFILYADIKRIVSHVGLGSAKRILECSEIPEAYRDHLEDPEMRMVYYRWGGSWYRIQMKFLAGSCIVLKHGLGCMLSRYRPLICVVWPFWWREGSNPLDEDFEIEVIGECTMAKLWGFTPERIMLELDMDESGLKRDLRGMYIALKENGYVFREAYDRGVEPSKLLEWLIARYMSSCF